MNRQSTPLEEIFTKCQFILRTHKNGTQQQKNLNKNKLSQTLVQAFHGGRYEWPMLLLIREMQIKTVRGWEMAQWLRALAGPPDDQEL